MPKPFDPRNRQSLIESICPPENYSVDCIVGTTYSMDFESLTAMLIGCLALEAEPEKHEVLEHGAHQKSSAVNTLYSLRAINRFANSVRIYVNHGCIHPRRYSPLFPLYDRIVRQVSFVKDATPAHFHPKVLIIKYISTKEEPKERYRLLVLSRNLTRDPFLDLALVMEGVFPESRKPNGKKVAEFIGHITRLPQEKMEEVPERIVHLIRDLPKLRFQPPPGSEDFDFLWNSPGIGTLINHVPRSGRALVVSPFLDNAFVNRLLDLKSLILISTSEALERLSEETFGRLSAGGQNKIYTIDPDMLDDENNPAEAMDRAYGLHAKMFLFEDEKRITTLLGSANATMRGFERNCEAMVSLSPGISIANFCSNFLFKDKKVLHAFIREYHENDYQAVNQEEKEKHAATERTIEAARMAVCQLDLTQSYHPSANRLVLRATNNLLAALDPELVTVRLCPLTLVERYHDSFPDLPGVFKTEGLSFPNCLLRELTEFVHCNIRDSAKSARIDFIIKTRVDFLHLLDKRDQDIKASLLSRGDDFLRLILFGTIPQIDASAHQGDRNPNIGKDGFTMDNLLGESVTIEDVMRACTEDPDKIEEINQWLRDLQMEVSAESTIPFIQFWTAFTTAIKETGTRSKTCH